jgi:hypothetical protein
MELTGTDTHPTAHSGKSIPLPNKVQGVFKPEVFDQFNVGWNIKMHRARIHAGCRNLEAIIPFGQFLLLGNLFFK